MSHLSSGIQGELFEFSSSTVLSMSDASCEGPTVTFSFMMKWRLQSEQES